MVAGSRPASSAACSRSGTRSAMSRRPWIGIQPSQYSTTWRNVTGPPAPPMMIGGCGWRTGLGQLHDGEKRTYSPSNDAGVLGPQLADRQHVLAGDGPTAVGIDAVVLHLVDVPARRRSRAHPPTGEVVERGDGLGLHDRIVLGDERDAGGQPQPLGDRSRDGEGDERVEGAAVLLGQLGPAGPRRAPARRDVRVLGHPERLEAACLRARWPTDRGGSTDRSGTAGRRCACRQCRRGTGWGSLLPDAGHPAGALP